MHTVMKVEEYRNCMKEVQAQRQREVYAQQEAKDALIKSFWIAVLVGIAGLLITFIITSVSGKKDGRANKTSNRRN
ncbi:MAG: hypothetical protein CM15mV72_370 [uncultured marine virus]|nr:MAG: hypothetical protein CM15mV72_370 [uncultured marine virus]